MESQIRTAAAEMLTSRQILEVNVPGFADGYKRGGVYEKQRRVKDTVDIWPELDNLVG